VGAVIRREERLRMARPLNSQKLMSADKKLGPAAGSRRFRPAQGGSPIAF
jgi:hypothetical protein